MAETTNKLLDKDIIQQEHLSGIQEYLKTAEIDMPTEQEVWLIARDNYDIENVDFKNIYFDLIAENLTEISQELLFSDPILVKLSDKYKITEDDLFELLDELVGSNEIYDTIKYINKEKYTQNYCKRNNIQENGFYLVNYHEVSAKLDLNSDIGIREQIVDAILNDKELEQAIKEDLQIKQKQTNQHKLKP